MINYEQNPQKAKINFEKYGILLEKKTNEHLFR